MSNMKKNVLWNLLGNVLPLVAGLIFMPLVLEAYGVERLGLIALAWSLIGYFSLFDLGLSRALTQILSKLLEQKKSKQDVSELLATSFSLMWLLGFAGGILLWLLCPFIVSDLLGVTQELQSETVIAFSFLSISIPIVVHTSALRGVLEALHLFKSASIIRMALGVGTFVAPCIASIYSSSLVSAVVSLVAVRVVVWLMHLVEVKRAGLLVGTKQHFNQIWLKPLFSFGGWITISNIVGPVMIYMDRFVIVSVLGVASVAFYVAPFEVVTKLLVIPAAISGVLFPFFARSSVNGRSDAPIKLNQGLCYSLILLYPLCLVGSYLSGEWLGLWLGEAFSEQGKIVVIWLVAGVLMNGIAQVLFAKVQGVGRSDWTAALHVIEVLPYLAVLWFSLKGWGIAGAAFAWFLRVMVDALALVFLVWKINPLNLKYSKKTLSVIFICLIGLLMPILIEPLLNRMIVLSVLLFVYLIMSFKIIRQDSIWALLISSTKGRKHGLLE